MVLVCTHAPIGTGNENTKDALYEDLIQTFDKLSGNIIKLVLGDLNAKIGRKTNFIPMIGRESVYETSNGNELRLISLAAAKDMIINSTTFPHKNLYMVTWKSPKRITVNQIDHGLFKRVKIYS